MPAIVRHTLNLESGLNDGLALPFVLFFLVLAQPGRRRRRRGREAARRGGLRRRRRRGARASSAGGSTTTCRAAGSPRRYEGIYAIGFGLAAFGLADVTFGNGLIAAFVAGIALGAAEHEIPDAFVEFAENVSAIFQVITFFVFGALIVATGYDGDDLARWSSSSSSRCSSRGRWRSWSRFVRSRLPGPAEAVHRLVRAEGRRVDAVRPLRARSRPSAQRRARSSTSPRS